MPDDAYYDEIVRRFNATRQGQVDALDNLLVEYYAGQLGKLEARESILRRMLHETFIGGLAWTLTPGMAQSPVLTSPPHVVRAVRRKTLVKIARWERITEKTLLQSISTERQIIAGISPDKLDKLHRAVNTMSRDHFKALADEFPDNDFWRARSSFKHGDSMAGSEDFTQGRLSNVLGFIQAETRRVREKVVGYSSHNARPQRRDVTKWVEEIRTNRNTFKLSETAHGRGLYRWSTTQAYPPSNFAYRLDAPLAKMANVVKRPGGTTARYLHNVKSGPEWASVNMALQAGKKTSRSGGIGELGFQHGDFSTVAPIPKGNRKLMEAFARDAVATRAAFLAALERAEKK